MTAQPADNFTVTTLASANSTGIAPPLPTWTTVDIGRLPDDDQQVDDEPQWVIDPLLERGSRLLFAGDEGSGKSLFLAQQVVHLAAGRATLPGAEPVGPLRCLVVDTELNIRTARRRLRPMAAHAGLVPGQLVYVLAPAGIDLLQPADHDALVALTDKFRPHVLVVDSLYRAFNGDPDDPRIGGQVQRVLDTIRARTGAAIIIACHYRKRATDGRTRRTLDDLAGSRVWKAWPETAVDITSDRLRILKDREGLAAELNLARTEAGQWENDPDGWPFTITSDQATAEPWAGHTTIQAYARAVLARADTPLSTSRITDLIGEDRALESKPKFHRTNVAAALGELHGLGHANKQPGARGANDWTLTPTGLEATSHTPRSTP